MQENETIHDRIKELVTIYANGKNTLFASMIGTSEGNIRGYIKGVIPKQDILEKIVRSIDVNSDWLLTGRGNMKFTDSNEKSNIAVSSENISKELLLMIQNKDAVMREMAEEIGSLKQTIKQLRKELGDTASAANGSTIASVG